MGESPKMILPYPKTVADIEKTIAMKLVEKRIVAVEDYLSQRKSKK